MKMINLTPHKIVFRGEYDPLPGRASTLEIEPSGQIARVSMEYAEAEQIHVEDGSFFGAEGGVHAKIEHVDTVRVSYGEIEGLPEPADGTIYIVSAIVAQAAMRADVLSPDTGPTAIRDENGQIQAVRRFIRHTPSPPAESGWSDDLDAYEAGEDTAFLEEEGYGIPIEGNDDLIEGTALGVDAEATEEIKHKALLRQMKHLRQIADELIASGKMIEDAVLDVRTARELTELYPLLSRDYLEANPDSSLIQ